MATCLVDTPLNEHLPLHIPRSKMGDLIINALMDDFADAYANAYLGSAIMGGKPDLEDALGQALGSFIGTQTGTWLQSNIKPIDLGGVEHGATSDSASMDYHRSLQDAKGQISYQSWEDKSGVFDLAWSDYATDFTDPTAKSTGTAQVPKATAAKSDPSVAPPNNYVTVSDAINKQFQLGLLLNEQKFLNDNFPGMTTLPSIAPTPTVPSLAQWIFENQGTWTGGKALWLLQHSESFLTKAIPWLDDSVKAGNIMLDAMSIVEGYGIAKDVTTLGIKFLAQNSTKVWFALATGEQYLGRSMGVIENSIAQLFSQSETTMRQLTMLEKNVAVNVSPEDWFKNYTAIGKEGTYVTDRGAIFPYQTNTVYSPGIFTQFDNNILSYYRLAQLETNFGLEPGSLANGIRITEINGINELQPRSPLTGNSLFRGPGLGLPNTAPEIVINSISTELWPPNSTLSK